MGENIGKYLAPQRSTLIFASVVLLDSVSESHRKDIYGTILKTSSDSLKDN